MGAFAVLQENVIAFFGVQTFGFVVGIVLADWITGIIREIKRKNFSWLLVPLAPIKLVNYTLVFTSLHGFSLAFPVAESVEQFVLLAICTKELISFFQNVKAIGIIDDKNTKFLDQAIEFLRLNTWQANLDKVKSKSSYTETE